MTTASTDLTRAPSAHLALHDRLVDLPATLDRAGREATRVGLAVVIAWIGGMKFTAYEAAGISGFVQSSPLLSWTYDVMSRQAVSNALGVAEIVIAVLVMAGRVVPALGIAGALGGLAMFGTTLSFMLSTPGVFEPTAGGFPALSVVPGQFLVKDLVLFGASLWLLAGAVATWLAAPAGRSTGECLTATR